MERESKKNGDHEYWWVDNEFRHVNYGFKKKAYKKNPLNEVKILTQTAYYFPNITHLIEYFLSNLNNSKCRDRNLHAFHFLVCFFDWKLKSFWSHFTSLKIVYIIFGLNCLEMVSFTALNWFNIHWTHYYFERLKWSVVKFGDIFQQGMGWWPRRRWCKWKDHLFFTLFNRYCWFTFETVLVVSPLATSAVQIHRRNWIANNSVFHTLRRFFYHFH